jgi:hypothetical protein
VLLIVTLRRRVLSRRAGLDQPLEVNVELAAASMLSPMWWDVAWNDRRWWEGWSLVFGARVEAKVRRVMPGCRPGWWYAVGRVPPVPLLGPEPPAETMLARDAVTIGGVRHWRLGEGWQVCQAEHLRAIGEVDGAEWTRYRAWKRAGFPCDEYRLDEFPDRPGGYMVHLCY